jgi:hypothetical protein
MYLVGTDGTAIPGSLYAKVVRAQEKDSEDTLIRLTSSSPEIETFLSVLSSAAANSESDQARTKVDWTAQSVPKM